VPPVPDELEEEEAVLDASPPPHPIAQRANAPKKKECLSDMEHLR